MSTAPTGIVGVVQGSRSASFRALNAHLVTPPVSSPSPSAKGPLIAKERPVKRIRQDTAGMNKTERAFYDWLPSQINGEMCDVLSPQSITLRLGNGVRYTPDFFTVEHEPLDDAAGCAQTLRAYEVKGFMRDDAAVKLKVAASLYPWIKFHLVTKKKARDGGGWDIQEVLP